MVIIITLPVIDLGIANEVKMEVYWEASGKDFFTFKRNALRETIV